MESNNDYNTKNYNTEIESSNNNERHIANIELARLIKNEINIFFEEENKKNYLKFFSENEAKRLRASNFGKKNVAIIDKLSEELNMSPKTFYHMLNGKNSQFNKIVEVLNFFGLTFRYDVFLQDSRVVEDKKDLYLKEQDSSITPLEDDIFKLILTLDKNTQEMVKDIILRFGAVEETKKNTSVKY